MPKVFTAVNPHQPGLAQHIADALMPALQSGAQARAYALVDTAFKPAVLKRINHASPSEQPVSLYSATELSGLTNVSPYLVPLSKQPQTLQQQVESLTRHANGSPMLSFLISPLDTQELKAQFLPLLKIETEDEQRLPLRFADTRILPVFLSVLEKPQTLLHLAHISRWWSIDRKGALVLLHSEKSSNVSALSQPHKLDAPLKLSNKQYAHMLEAAEADALINHLYLVVAEQCLRFQPGDLYEFISQQLALASRFGIENFNDQTAYCIGAFNTAGKLHENACAKEILEGRKWTKGDLATALADMPEECWGAM